MTNPPRTSQTDAPHIRGSSRGDVAPTGLATALCLTVFALLASAGSAQEPPPAPADTAAEAGSEPEICPCPPPEPPPPPPPIWTGGLGAGLALTSGNTESESFNLNVDAIRDTGGRHLLKLDALYLRGKANDTLNVDKATAGARDDYRINERLAAFGELRWRRDRFQNLDMSLAPIFGLAFAVVSNESVSWNVDAGLGYLVEEYRDGSDDSSGTFRLGEVLTWQISPNAKLGHLLTGTWKLDDTDDALYHVELRLVTTLTERFDLEIALIDDYRNQPISPELDKNDLSTLIAIRYRL